MEERKNRWDNLGISTGIQWDGWQRWRHNKLLIKLS